MGEGNENLEKDAKTWFKNDEKSESKKDKTPPKSQKVQFMKEETDETLNKDDILDSENTEDKEILQSIAYAEKQMGQKMGTPTRLKKETWSPVKYDVEDLNTRIDSGILDQISHETQEPKQT